MIDERSAKFIETLLPEVRDAFIAFIVDAKELVAKSGLDYKVICGTRTFEEQAALYANTQRQLITSDADPDGSSGYIRPFVNGVSMRIRPCAMHAVWLSRVSASENASHSLL